MKRGNFPIQNSYSSLGLQPQSAMRKIACSRRKHRDEAVTTFGRETSQWMVALTSKMVLGCFADVDTPLKFDLDTCQRKSLLKTR